MCTENRRSRNKMKRLIQNGLIVDGSGRPAYPGDLLLSDGKIAKIAPSIQEEQVEVIYSGRR